MDSDTYAGRMPDAVAFPEETVSRITWTALKEYREFTQPLCIEDDKIFLGGKPVYGTEHGVPALEEKPGMCESGEMVGRIHSHIEEYEERPPFDKGSSNIDVFSIAKETLHESIFFPRLECTVSPTYDKDNYLNGVRIGCERFNRFTEDDIRQMESGIIHHREGRDVEEMFGDEDIEFLKYGRPPRGMYARTGFIVRMANLKRGLKRKGFMTYDEFYVNCKRDRGKFLCDFKDETLTFKEG